MLSIIETQISADKNRKVRALIKKQKSAFFCVHLRPKS